MNSQNSITFVVSLPLLMCLWQGSSCRTSVATNRASAVNANNPGSTNQGRDVRGMWGGPHISMEVSDSGAEIEYDCAHGRITEKIVPDRNGNFEVKGVHISEHPGPVRKGEENERPASYRGSIHDETMTLTVTLTAKNETIGTFTLSQGKSGRVFKCK